MDIQTVAIIGKGALGLLFADLVEHALGPESVHFVMDGERYARHVGEEVFVNGEPRAFNTVEGSQAAPVDLVIFAVKATGLDDAIDLAAPLVGPHTRMVSLLNGITSEERIAARYGWANLVLCVAQGMDAVFLGSEFTYTHPGELRFGAAEGTEAQTVADLAAFCERVGIAHTVEEDIWRRLWTKLMLNVGINQTCMVYGGTYGSATEPGEQNRTFVAAMREALAVANAEGVALTEADLAAMAALMASLEPDGMPSMAQDRINRKPTEVAEFAGTIIGRAERHGILVPTNRWLYERIRAIEASYGA